MTKTVLLTLGRLPKALELARAFHTAGWRVVIAEPFAWHVSRLSKSVAKCIAVPAPADNQAAYLNAILDAARAEGASLIVPVSEESMHVAALHGRLPPGIKLYAPPQETLLKLHNKQSFISVAQNFGLAVPETFAANTAEAAVFAAKTPHVVKPIFSCSGKGVRISKDAAPLPTEDRSSGIIVQRFIPGQVLSSFSIAHQGRVLISSIYRGTVMSGTVSVAFEREKNKRAVEAWISEFVTKQNYSGFISFDFVETGNSDVYAIECNPRMTSGAHFVHPEDFARAITDPENPAPIRFKDKTLFQQFYPCLTETQKSFFKPELRRNNRKYLLSSRDVIWERSDPWPFVLMPLTSYEILKLTIFKGLSFGEAATRDIEWQGSGGSHTPHAA